MSNDQGGWDEKKDSADRSNEDAAKVDREDDFQIRQDAEHLKILAIIWYVMAGLSLIGVCAGIFYAVVGSAAVAGSGTRGAAPAGIFLCFGIGIIAMSLIGGALNFFVARNLQRRKGHLFCLIIAGLICLNIPLGTALGVFTIIVLLRPTVKKAFGVE